MLACRFCKTGIRLELNLPCLTNMENQKYFKQLIKIKQNYAKATKLYGDEAKEN